MDEFQRIIEEILLLNQKFSGLLDETAFFSKKGLVSIANESTGELAELSEKITLLVRSIVSLSAGDIGSTRFLKVDYPTNPMSIKVGFTEHRWFVLDIPALLPKKGKRKSVEYIKSSAAIAMMRFFLGKPKITMDNCVIIFRHLFSINRPERKYRDYDNVEVKAVTDLIASFLMKDDGPLCCSFFHCSAESDHDRTEVYVIPMADFIDWTYGVIFKEFTSFELLDYDGKNPISEV